MHHERVDHENIGVVACLLSRVSYSPRLWSPVHSQTAVPLLLNYQGELRSPTTSEPGAHGPYNMVFRIYGVLSGGTPLWTGTYCAANGNPIQVENGIFSFMLGSASGNDLDASTFNGFDRWPDVEVQGRRSARSRESTPRLFPSSRRIAVCSTEGKLRISSKMAAKAITSLHAVRSPNPDP